MGNRWLVVVLGVAVAAGIAFWVMRGNGRDSRATATVTQGSAATPATSGTVVESTLANLTITISDATGPIAGAVARLAPEDGDVIVLRTGTDGLARTKLAAGRYTISGSATGHEPAALEAREVAAGEDVRLTLTLTLGGRALTGVITDATGGPVAGARVDAALLGVLARPGDAIASTSTGTDGRYALTVVEGQHLVAVSSPDYAPQSRHVEVGADGATADFALVPGGVIEGVVRDERTRQPVVGAIVDARRDGGGPMELAEGSGRRAFADVSGRFRLTGLRPGAYEVGARRGSQIARTPTIVGLGVAEQVTDVEILIGVGPTVTGKVVDDGGAPIAGATVEAMGRGRGADARSDAAGAFTLVGLAPGDYFVIARSDHHLPAGGVPLQLAAADVTGLVVKVRRGVVVNGHTEPRQRCEITMAYDDRDPGLGLGSMVAPRSSSADGNFEVGPVRPGKATLSARCASGDQGTVHVEVRDAMAEIVIPVKPGASIAGRVIDKAGKPVAGVTVMAALGGPTQTTMIINGMVTSGVQAHTTVTGSFELVGLTAGTYKLSVLDRGRPLRMRGSAVAVKLGATDRKTGVELAVDRPDGVIDGVVTGPDGRPLADAWVSVHQDLDALVRGMMGGRGSPDDGDGGETGDGGDDADGGRGSRMMVVEDSDDGGGAGADFPPALTDDQGRFRIAGLPHANYHVVAEAQAGTLRGRAPSVTPDATVTIQALGVTSLAGTVRGPSGPAALFSITLDGPTTATRTFTDGKFKLGRVDPGTYKVHVSSADGNADAVVTVLANQPATVDLVLVSNAIVVGRLVDAAGKPLADVGVALIPDAGDGRVAISLEGPPPMSGADGSFRLETKAGPTILVVLTQPRPITHKGLALEAGKTLDVGAIEVSAGDPPAP